MPTSKELKELQILPLSFKIEVSRSRIREFYNAMEGKVYVAFSGGKDSSVLLHLVRSLYPEVIAVYGNTGIDYPSIKAIVNQTDNVKILAPLKTFGRILKEDGIVFPSKIGAKLIKDARRGIRYAVNYVEGKNKDGSASVYKKSNYGKLKQYLDVKVKISDKCCDYLKEIPMANFEKESGLKPYVGLLATESTRRRDAWLKTGCNSFKKGKEKSKPLSFWNDSDILQYIVENKIKIADEYGEIRKGEKGYYLTGEQRTGCMFCPVPVAHNRNRLDHVKKVVPKMYDTFINKLGLGEMYKKLGVDYEK